MSPARNVNEELAEAVTNISVTLNSPIYDSSVFRVNLSLPATPSAENPKEIVPDPVFFRVKKRAT